MCSFLKRIKDRFWPATARYRYWDRAETHLFMGERVRYYVPAFRQRKNTDRIQKWVESAYEPDYWANMTPEEDRVFQSLLPDCLKSGWLRERK
jgi:hypothetical protein